jgi:hypothetical protein
MYWLQEKHDKERSNSLVQDSVNLRYNGRGYNGFWI